MKKSFMALLVAVLALLVFDTVHAAGDIAGEIYSTDILTQVDGRDIKSFAIDGMMMIALEDLAPYGFTVYYNDNVRTLFVTKTFSPSDDFNPIVERGTVGKKIGYYYKTDIVAYVNGRRVETYALDGKLSVPVEKLWTAGSNNVMSYVHNGQYVNPFNVFEDKNSMTCTYDDSKRLLSLTTEQPQGVTKDVKADALFGVTTPWRSTREPLLHNDKYIYIGNSLGGLTPGSIHRPRYIVMPDGMHYDALDIMVRYGLHSHTKTYMDIFEPVLSEDGESMYFIHKFDGGQDYKKFNLSSMQITPIEEHEYIDAKSYVKKSDYTLTMDGLDLPLYNLGGRDYICADDLQKCGFTVSYDYKSDCLCILKTSIKNEDYIVSDFKVGKGTLVNGNTTLFINGGYTDEHDMVLYEDKYFIPVDAFTYDDYYLDGIGTVRYSYNITDKKITAYTCEDTAVNYSSDGYDTTHMVYQYDLLYNSEAEKTYDSGEKYANRLIGYGIELFLVKTDSIVHPITQQLVMYSNKRGLDISIDMYQSMKYEYDGTIVTFLIDGIDPIKYDVSTMNFVK